MKIDQDRESSVWSDGGGFEEACRYSGFQRDDHVFGGDSGVGICRCGNSVDAEESFHPSVFIGSEVREELVCDLVVVVVVVV